MDRIKYDVVVVGAGPVGLYAGFLCGMRELKTIVCDSLEKAGGQLSVRYPQKAIYNLPGHEKITAEEFIARLERQLDTVSTHVGLKLGFKVEAVSRCEEGFEIRSPEGVLTAETVIIAVGSGSFEPKRIGLTQEADFDNIAYSVTNPADYTDQDILVLGGGDSAVDWALALEPLSSCLTLAHRRREFRAQPANISRLAQTSARILTPYIPEALHGAGRKITAVELEEVGTEKRLMVPCTDVIVSYGVQMSANPLQDWGLDLTGGKVQTDQGSRTGIPGIFACGDVCGYENRQMQIATGFSEAVMAVAGARRFIVSSRKEAVSKTE